MATRKTFAAEIVARARKIEWTVEPMNSGGWKIRCPDGHVVQVHLTPSDVNAPNHILAELNAHGFAEAEAEWVRLSAEERDRRREAHNLAAQNALDEAQKRADRQAELLAKAAGINTRIDPKLLITPYPVPKAFERVLVTPELAEQLLEINTDNRPIRPNDVEFWAGVIERGEWLYTHQGIAIDIRGVLQDGQHRLSAIVKTGIAVELMISIGMPVKNYTAVDGGTKRNGGDMVARYGLPSRSRISTIARMIVLYDAYPDRQFNDRVSNTEIDNVVAEYGGTILDAYNRGQAMYQSFRILPTAAAMGIYLLWREVGRDDPRVTEFIESTIVGANLDDKDPRLALRNSALNPSAKRRTIVNQLAHFLKAWNYYATGRKVRFITWRKDEDYPKVFVPVPLETDATLEPVTTG